MNYPDNVHPGDPRAPWNMPDPEPEAICEYCGIDLHEGDCAFDTNGIGYLCESCFWKQFDMDNLTEGEMIKF